MGISPKPTLEIHRHIAKVASTQADDCCVDAALANWTICNLVYAGCRGIKWIQSIPTHLIYSHHLDRFRNVYAFTLQDDQCTTASNQLLTIPDAWQNPNEAGCIRLRFEEQKNGENGERYGPYHCSPCGVTGSADETGQACASESHSGAV